MCGIVGIVATSGVDLHPALQAATRSLAHRGPDDEGLELFTLPEGTPSVGLGVRRLAILDLSPASHQPMNDPVTGNWIAHNGEVYNFRDLRRELEAAGHRFRTQSDTEVLLHSYAAWGKDCVHRWRGMFATAIWDARGRRWILFRDRLGIKPLYYCFESGRLAFASEVRALVCGGFVDGRLNPAALHGFLGFGAVQEPDTIVKGVVALPPGHWLVWENGRIEASSYWNPLAARPAFKPIALGQLLREAAECCLVSDVPVGVFLSGGIDSSSVVALLSRGGRAPLQTFSVVFSEAAFSEAAYARLVAQQFGTEHHELLLGEEELLAQLPAAIAAMDQPSTDGINTYVVSRAVHQAGLKVALSGLGGDELFGGYPTFSRAGRLEQLQSASRRLPAVGRKLLAEVFSVLPFAAEQKRKLKEAVQFERYPAPYFLLRALFLPDKVRQLLTPEASAAATETSSLRLRELAQEVSSLDEFARISWLELRHYTLNTLLRDADQMSMANSLEVRVPLLDHMLVEGTLGLCGSPNGPRRLSKRDLLNSLPRPLPPQVVHRPKTGFTLPFELWLRRRLRQEVEGTLLGPSPALAGLLNEDGVRRVYRDFQQEGQSWSRIWALYVLKRWAENLMKGTG